MSRQNKYITIIAVVGILATFYSLHELHRISALHAEISDKKQHFATTTSVVNVASKAIETGKYKLPAKTGALDRHVGNTSVNGQTSKHASTDTDTTRTHSISTTVNTPQRASQVSATSSKKCYSYENMELWGDVVGWGTQISAKTSAECCKLCQDYRALAKDDPSCNVWVWCGDTKNCGSNLHQCWLKHLPYPEASKPIRVGPKIPWTSGTIDVDLNADPIRDKASRSASNEDRRFHIVTSAQGTAVHWQCRIHYYWYKKMKMKCEAEGGCEMGGFTRLLHSGKEDNLMDEIPTVVVDPLPQEMVEHSWYIVLNRPYAFVQWVQKVKIPERYVLMSEPDHIFLRPLPNFMTGDVPAAFPFFYIEPSKEINITRKFTGPISVREVEKIAPIGNSPTYMSFEDMKKVMPIWMNVSIAVFKDPEANNIWGWVQEMYGFTIACYLADIKRIDLYLHMMAQPPWDSEMEVAPGKPFYILHYTYGMDYSFNGIFTPGKYGQWRWDKRTYGTRAPPRHIGDPPAKMGNKLVRKLIDTINEASAAIPCWNEYAETGKILPCNESIVTSTKLQ